MAVGQKSTKKSKQTIKKEKIFTDRIKPRKAFWDLYHNYKETRETTGETDVSIITYYGIGGIGKTTLLHKLASEIDEYKQAHGVKAPMPYLYYDFDWGTDKITVLTKMRDELKTKYKFKFPLYNAALMIYKEKSEGKRSTEEDKGYFADNELLGAAGDFIADSADMLNFIPGVGPAAISALKLADTIMSKVSDLKLDQQEDIKNLLAASPQEIYENLQYRFAEDLTDNLEVLEYPLVIFLDTYEQLVNELKNSGQPLEDDKWLRSLENGLAVYAPNTLWVIGGREYLKWAMIDEDWEDNLKDRQHLMGALSQSDTHEFLQKSGIEESDIREALFDVTGGTPVYLDLCVSNYRMVKSSGDAVSIDRLGKNKYELMERFLRYTDDTKEELLYILAALGSWREDEIYEITSNIMSGITHKMFQNIKLYSFVEPLEAGVFKLHNTIKDVLNEKCDPTLKNKINRAEHDYYGSKLLTQGVEQPRFAFYLMRYTENIIELGWGEKDIYQCIEEVIYPKIKALRAVYQYETAHQIMSVFESAEQIASHSPYWVMIRAKILKNMRSFKKRSEVMAYFDVIKENTLKNIGAGYFTKNSEAYQDLLDIEYHLLWDCRDKKAVMHVIEELLDIRKENLGENHLKTEDTKMSLAYTLSTIGAETRTALGLSDANHSDDNAELNDTLHYKKRGIMLSKEVYAARLKRFGIHHKDTLVAKRFYAQCLNIAGYYDKAAPLIHSAYLGLKDLLGENDLSTRFCASVAINICKNNKDYDTAYEISKDRYEALVQVNGEYHEMSIDCFKQLAQIEISRKNHHKAIEMLEDLFERSETHLGKNYYLTLNILIALTDAYKKNKPELYLKMREDLYYRQMAYNRGVHNKLSLNVAKSIAEAYMRDKLYEQALKWYEIIMAYLDTEMINNSDRMGSQLANVRKYRDCLIMLGQSDKADEFGDKYAERCYDKVIEETLDVSNDDALQSCKKLMKHIKITSSTCSLIRLKAADKMQEAEVRLGVYRRLENLIGNRDSQLVLDHIDTDEKELILSRIKTRIDENRHLKAFNDEGVKIGKQYDEKIRIVDGLRIRGNYIEALEQYQSIWETMKDNGHVDTYASASVEDGIILCMQVLKKDLEGYKAFVKSRIAFYESLGHGRASRLKKYLSGIESWPKESIPINPNELTFKSQFEKEASDKIEHAKKCISEKNYEVALEFIDDVLDFYANFWPVSDKEFQEVYYQKSICLKGLNRHEAYIETARRIMAFNNETQYFNKVAMTIFRINITGARRTLLGDAKKSKVFYDISQYANSAGELGKKGDYKSAYTLYEKAYDLVIQYVDEGTKLYFQLLIDFSFAAYKAGGALDRAIEIIEPAYEYARDVKFYFIERSTKEEALKAKEMDEYRKIYGRVFYNYQAFRDKKIEKVLDQEALKEVINAYFTYTNAVKNGDRVYTLEDEKALLEKMYVGLPNGHNLRNQMILKFGTHACMQGKRDEGLKYLIEVFNYYKEFFGGNDPAVVSLYKTIKYYQETPPEDLLGTDTTPSNLPLQ